MSQYDKLDDLIQQRLAYSEGMSLLHLSGGDVREECERLAAATGRESFRILDGRLTALKKLQSVEFVRRKGWRLKQA